MPFTIQYAMRVFQLFFPRNAPQETLFSNNLVMKQLQQAMTQLQKNHSVAYTLSKSPLISYSFKSKSIRPLPFLSPASLNLYHPSFSSIHKRSYTGSVSDSTPNSLITNLCKENANECNQSTAENHLKREIKKDSSTINSYLLGIALAGSLLASLLLAHDKVHAEEQVQSFAPPHPLTPEELNELASNLGLLPIQENEDIRQKCFEKLADACRKKEWETVTINKPLAEKITNDREKTLFLTMVEEGRGDQIQRLIEEDFEYRFCDSDGNNGLHLACRNGHTKLIDFLSKKFDIKNSKNNDNETPLHCAIKQRHVGTVRTLIEKGASLIIPWKSSKGTSSTLELAISSGKSSIVDVVMEEAIKADPQLLDTLLQVSDSAHGSLLHFAILKSLETGDTECKILRHLLTKHRSTMKILLKKADSNHRTLLHLATCEGLGSVIEFLVNKQGVSVDEVDVSGEKRTAAHWAVLKEQPAALIMLQSLGADLEKVDGKGYAPLVYCSGNSKDADSCRCILNLRQEITQKFPENLVFQGGGAKCLAYAGVVEALDEMNLMPAVKRVAGTSAGSIAAALVAVGYRGKELREPLSQDFTRFLDSVDHSQNVILKLFFEAPASNNLIEILAEFWEIPGFSSTQKIKNFLNKLLKEEGLCKGDQLLKWIEEKVKKQTKISHCTFRELNELVEKDGKGLFKDLYVYVLELSDDHSPKPHLRKLCHENEWKDIIISDAIRASCSIPGIFKPHQLHSKDSEGKRMPHNLHKYVDAGLHKNFPLDVFDDNTYQNKKEEGRTTNWKTWGFKLKSLEPATSNITKDGLIITKCKNIFKNFIEKHSLIKLCEKVLNAICHAEDILLEEYFSEKKRIIAIPISDTITTLSFDLPQDQREALINAGKKATNEFLKISARDLSKLTEPEKKFKLPPADTHFVERKSVSGFLKEVIDTTRKEWDSNHPLKRRLIYGLGGMGKSEALITFANDHFSDFSLIWVLDGSKMQSAYQELAEELGIPCNTREQISSKVLGYLKNNHFTKPWLLIYDNIDDESTLKIGDLPERGGVVLITSRQQVTGLDNDEQLEIQPFSSAEAIEFLKTITNEPDSEEMKLLAADLAYFPLAISQAAHFIKINELSIKEYRKIYNVKNNPLNAPMKPTPRQDASKYELVLKDVWTTTLEKLQNNFPLATEWLKLCSYLHFNDIPREWISKWAGDEKKGVEVFYTLRKYALIKWNPDNQMVSIHPLMREVLRSAEKSKQNTALLHAYEFVKKQLIQWTSDAVDSWGKARDSSKALPHAREIVNIALSHELQNELQGFSEFVFHLLEAYDFFGHYQEEESLANELLEKKTFQENSSLLAKIYYHKGFALGRQMKSDEANDSLNKALAYTRSDDKIYYQILVKIAGNLLDKHQYDKSLAKLDDIFKLEKSGIFEENDSILASAYHLKGFNFYHMGCVAIKNGNEEKGNDLKNQAVAHFKKALDIKKKRYGDHHYETAYTYSSLGTCLGSSGQFEDAYKNHQSALNIRQRYFGEMHPQTALCYSAISQLFCAQKKFEEALRHIESALNISSKVNVADKHAADYYRTKGECLNGLGRTEEALAAYLEAFTLLSRHPEEKDNAINYLKCAVNCLKVISDVIDSQKLRKLKKDITRRAKPLKEKYLKIKNTLDVLRKIEKNVSDKLRGNPFS